MEFQWLNFLPVNLVSALYSTLFYSLWIGVVMGLIAGIIVMATKNASPSLRYNLLTALLGLFSLSMIFVFYQALGKVNLLHSYINPGVLNPVQLFGITFVGDIDSVLNALGTYANQLLLIWLSIILLKAIKLIIGLKGVHHLKRTRVFDAGVYWQNKVVELSQQLYIKQSVQILQSGIAKIPMVIGHFKPIILTPLGMLNHLSLNEVEAILCHELAHIKRRDYLVNILQNILEVLFFFNPAVLWISKMIRDERENCCDDLAISCTDDKNAYLRALVSCQEFNLNVNGFAMSMVNGKGQLNSRIRRIAFNKKGSLGSVEKMILAVSFLFVFALSAAFTISQKPELLIKATEKMAQQGVKQGTTEVLKTGTAAPKKINPIAIKTSNLIKAAEPIGAVNSALTVVKERNIGNPSDVPETSAKVTPVKSVQFDVPPVLETVSTTISTTTTTVKIDGKVTVQVTYHDKDARADIKKDMLNDSIIGIGENPSYILNTKEMLVNGVKQDAYTHQKYKEKYITKPDTQYRIGT